MTRCRAHTSSHAVVEPTDLPSDASASRSRISASVAPRPAARRRTSQRVYRHGESICFGNSILIRRMSARTPASMRGRPPKFRDFQRQSRQSRWSFSQLPAIVTCDSPGEAPRRAARARHFSSQISIPPAAASERRRPSRPAAFTRAGLSAVTLEPLRPRAAHVVQLRSIAAVRQGGSDGPDNGQEIHPLFPTPFAHACSGRNFRPTHGTCAAIM